MKVRVLLHPSDVKESMQELSRRNGARCPGRMYEAFYERICTDCSISIHENWTLDLVSSVYVCLNARKKKNYG